MRNEVTIQIVDENSGGSDDIVPSLLKTFSVIGPTKYIMMFIITLLRIKHFIFFILVLTAFAGSDLKTRLN